MRDTGRQLEITRRWFSPVVFFLVPFWLIWVGVLWGVYSGMLSAEAGPSTAALLFPMLHVAVGVGLGYFLLATLMNTTAITVGVGTMTVRHGPIPWRGNRTIRVADVQQLYVREKVHNSDKGRSVSYQLMLETNVGTTVTLLKGLGDRDQGKFIEQQIEKRLGIVNVYTMADCG